MGKRKFSRRVAILISEEEWNDLKTHAAYMRREGTAAGWSVYDSVRSCFREGYENMTEQLSDAGVTFE